MNEDIENLVDYMKGRLDDLEHLAKQGVIPGQLDTLELEQVKGAIKELKRTIGIAESLLIE